MRQQKLLISYSRMANAVWVHKSPRHSTQVAKIVVSKKQITTISTCFIFTPKIHHTNIHLLNKLAWQLCGVWAQVCVMHQVMTWHDLVVPSHLDRQLIWEKERSKNKVHLGKPGECCSGYDVTIHYEWHGCRNGESWFSYRVRGNQCVNLWGSGEKSAQSPSESSRRQRPRCENRMGSLTAGTVEEHWRWSTWWTEVSCIRDDMKGDRARIFVGG